MSTPLDELERLKADINEVKHLPLTSVAWQIVASRLMWFILEHADYLLSAAREAETLREDAEQGISHEYHKACHSYLFQKDGARLGFADITEEGSMRFVPSRTGVTLTARDLRGLACKLEVLQCTKPPVAAMSEEEWLPVAEFSEFYEVSVNGVVRSLPRADELGRIRAGKVLKPFRNKEGGYERVYLSDGEVKGERYVHRIVAQAFVPNPEGLPQVNHKDGNKSNNAADNLEWVQNIDNTLHAKRVLGIGTRPIVARSIADGSKRTFRCLAEAEEAGFHRRNIQACLAGKRRQHKGYTWLDAAIDSARKGEEG